MRERNTFSRPLEPWDKVMAARQMKRLASVDYMGQILTNHGIARRPLFP